MKAFRPAIALALGLMLAPALVTVASAQTNGAPVNSAPANGSGMAPGTEGSGANNSKPVGGPGLTGTPHAKTHKRHNKNFYGKHYNVNKHSKH